MGCGSPTSSAKVVVASCDNYCKVKFEEKSSSESYVDRTKELSLSNLSCTDNDTVSKKAMTSSFKSTKFLDLLEDLQVINNEILTKHENARELFVRYFKSGIWIDHLFHSESSNHAYLALAAAKGMHQVTSPSTSIKFNSYSLVSTEANNSITTSSEHENMVSSTMNLIRKLKLKETNEQFDSFTLQPSSSFQLMDYLPSSTLCSMFLAMALPFFLQCTEYHSLMQSNYQLDVKNITHFHHPTSLLAPPTAHSTSSQHSHHLHQHSHHAHQSAQQRSHQHGHQGVQGGSSHGQHGGVTAAAANPYYPTRKIYRHYLQRLSPEMIHQLVMNNTNNNQNNHNNNNNNNTAAAVLALVQEEGDNNQAGTATGTDINTATASTRKNSGDKKEKIKEDNSNSNNSNNHNNNNNSWLVELAKAIDEFPFSISISTAVTATTAPGPGPAPTKVIETTDVAAAIGNSSAATTIDQQDHTAGTATAISIPASSSSISTRLPYNNTTTAIPTSTQQLLQEQPQQQGQHQQHQHQQWLLAYVNPAFETLTGYPASECLGQDARFLQCMHTELAQSKKISRAIQNKESCKLAIVNQRNNKSGEEEEFLNFLSLRPCHSRVAGSVASLAGSGSSNRQYYLGMQYDIDAPDVKIQHLQVIDEMILCLSQIL